MMGMSRNRIAALLGGLALAAMALPAQAAVIIDITGVPGAGVTTISFSGTSVAINDTVINASGVDDFDESTLQTVGSQSFLTDPLLQDVFFDVTGNLAVDINGLNVPITQIFLDDDDFSIPSFDDFGLRVASETAYSTGDVFTWLGSGTIALDFSAFNPGTYLNGDGGLGFAQAFFAANDEVTFNVTASRIPLPSTVLLILAGLAGLGFAARRRRTLQGLGG